MKQHKKEIILFFDKSQTFMDAAIIIAKQTSHPKYNHQEYKDVIASLTLQAFELFFKFCILSKIGNKNDYCAKLKRFNHNIKELYKEYKSLYIDSKYEIDCPFSFDDIDIPEELNINMDDFISNLNMSLRYPIDKRGDQPDMGFSFTVEDDLIEKYHNDMYRIGREIIQELLSE
jgi:hypothetical protein